MVYLLNSFGVTADVPKRLRVSAPFEITEDALAHLGSLHSSMADRDHVDDADNAGMRYMNGLDALIVCEACHDLSDYQSELLNSALLNIIIGAAPISDAELARLMSMSRLSLFYRPELFPDEAVDAVFTHLYDVENAKFYGQSSLCGVPLITSEDLAGFYDRAAEDAREP